MKLLKNISGLASSLQKLDFSNFTIPTAEKMAPWFVSGLSGFVAASAVGLVAAHQFMPKVQAFSASDLGPQEPTVFVSDRPTEGEFKTIVSRNIFNSEGGAVEDKNEAGCEVKKSELPLKFTGVIFGGRSEASIVVLESTTTKQADTFLLGEAVPGDAKIVEITRDKVFFEKNNCKEFLALEQPELPKKRIAGEKKRTAKPSVAATGENVFREEGFERNGSSIAADRRWMEKAITVDFAKTLQDAKASPNTVNGEVKGFVLTRIRPDSVYEKMGLQDGDVICAINGIELNDAARAIQTLNAMRNESKLEVCVMRNGQRSNLDVQVK
ncbi:MAG: PDZ domain-containing protein [Silvanigrellales bacterium]|jgi:general secretion pathway protein C|nr:PDZ domain-containing protein [Silvanigrellales bacterium]